MDNFWSGGFLYNPQNNSVLLHQRDSHTQFNPNTWAFLGGLSQNNETPLECFLREIYEEIELLLRPQQVIKLYDYFNQEFSTHRFVFYSINSQPVSEFRLNEGKAIRWISLKELDRYKLTEKTERDLDYFKLRLVSK